MKRPPNFKRRYLAVALAGWSAFGVSYALPIDPTVVNGSASFAQNANTLNVTNSNGAIIDWQAFSINANEVVKFQQASASSSVLNRVTGPDPSVLLGMMQSNGQVFLVNTAGILVGAGARIDVAKFVASTLSISNADFLAGKLNFQGFTGAGNVTVENGAEIKTVSGGSVYLIGSNVENSGTITTPNGETILAAGSSVQLLDTASPGVKVEITGATGSATNLGTIVADAGRIGIVGALVKNGGTLSASSAVADGGHVYLRATNGNATQLASGKIEANGLKGGSVSIEASDTSLVDGTVEAVGTTGAGGSIDVFASKVGLINNASLNASGNTDGGSIRIGGDYQGGNANVQNAWVTWFGPAVQVKANAGANGNGGRVIVWSDDTTRFYGNISARGGSVSGNGGFAEVSGKRYLAYEGLVDLASPYGTVGVLLLDPSDLEIIAGATVNGGTNMSTTAGEYFQTSTTAASTLGWTNIQIALNSADLVVHTTNNIKVTGSPTGYSTTINHVDGSNTISKTYTSLAYSSPNKLTLLAGGDLELEASFGNADTSGTGALKLMAGWDGASVTTPVLGGSSKDILIGNDNNPVTIFSATGDVDLSATGKVLVQGGGIAGGSNYYSGIDLGSGNLSITAHLIEVLAGVVGTTNINNFAFIYGNGNQSYTVTGNSGHLWVKGGGLTVNTNDYGNYATIRKFGGGTQLFTIGGNTSEVLVQGGTGDGKTQFGVGSDCPTSGSVYCTNNYATIENSGAGPQTFSFTGTSSTFNITGGTNGGLTDSGGNYAQVKSRLGTQTISGTSAITLTSTSDGGYTDGTKDIGNEASLGADGTQNITASSLSLSATGVTANGVGGTYVVAPTQNITLTGNLSLSGGAATRDSKYHASGAAVIGYDGVANATIQASNVTLTGGSGAYGGAWIGSVANAGTSTISITTSNGFNATNANTPSTEYGWAAIGSWNGNANITMTDTSTSGFNLGQYSKLKAGLGTVTFSAPNAGGASLFQDANSAIVANTITSSGNRSIIFNGLNNVNNFSGTSTLSTVTYLSSARTVHVTNASGTAVTLKTRDDTAANTLSGLSASTQRDIALGTVSASATSGTSVAVTTSGVILDDNASGVTNVTTQSTAVAQLKANQDTGSTNTNGNTSGSLAISADVDSPGTVTALVGTIGTNGGIAIRSVGTSAPATVTLNDQSSSGNVLFNRVTGPLTIGSGYSLTALNGAVTIASGGALTYGGAATLDSSSSNAVNLNAGGNLVFASNFTGTDNLALTSSSQISTGSNTINNGSTASMTLAAPDIQVATGGTLQSGTINVNSSGTVGVAGNITAANTITAVAAGTINVNGGTLLTSAGKIALTSSSNIELHQANVKARTDVGLNLLGSSSNLVVNVATDTGPSNIIAGFGGTTGVVDILFSPRESGGISISGVDTTTTTTGGSGFFFQTNATPAVLGNTLKVAYGTNVVSATLVLPTLIKATQAVLVEPTVKTVVATATDDSDTSGEFGSGDKSSSKSGKSGDSSDDKKSANKRRGVCS